MKSRIKRFSNFFALLLLFIIVLSYGSYRLAYFIGETYFFDKLFYKKSVAHGYSKLGPYDWKYKEFEPEIQERLAGLAYITNTPLNGGTSSQILGAKDDNVYTIVIIGDSMMYGLGIKQNKTVASVLEKNLNKIRKTKVYNLSIPADNFLDNYTKFVLAKESLQPDLVVIGMCDNDLIWTNLDRYPQKKQIFHKLRRQCEKPLFEDHWQESSISHERQVTEYYYPAFSTNYANVCLLDQVGNALKDENIIYFSFGLYPEDLNFSEDNYIGGSEKIYYAYYQALNKNNNTFLWPYKYNYDKVFKPVSNKEQHPSVYTHKKYAEVLFKEITTNPKWKFMEGK